MTCLDADDRITCCSCGNWTRRECSAWRACEAIRGYSPDPYVPRRCMQYAPRGDEQDQRSGRERWPTLERRIVHKERRQ